MYGDSRVLHDMHGWKLVRWLGGDPGTVLMYGRFLRTRWRRGYVLRNRRLVHDMRFWQLVRRLRRSTRSVQLHGRLRVHFKFLGGMQHDEWNVWHARVYSGKILHGSRCATHILHVQSGVLLKRNRI